MTIAVAKARRYGFWLDVSLGAGLLFVLL